MHWPHQEKGGQKGSSLAERGQGLGEGSRSALVFDLLFILLDSNEGCGWPKISHFSTSRMQEEIEMLCTALSFWDVNDIIGNWLGWARRGAG